ncbi:MAG: NADH-quinone oxidoreductase subunit A [Caldimicrobium sp.]
MFQSPDTYLPTSYFPIFIMLAVGFLFGLGGLIFGALVRPKFYYPYKLQPYECGNEPSGLPWQRLTIRYFPIAILFAIFDVEIALLYPWCIGFSQLTIFGFVTMLIFLIILLLGFIYDYKKQLLDWYKSPGERTYE